MNTQDALSRAVLLLNQYAQLTVYNTIREECAEVMITLSDLKTALADIHPDTLKCEGSHSQDYSERAQALGVILNRHERAYAKCAHCGESIEVQRNLMGFPVLVEHSR